jgi:hypothetical protein
LRRFGSGSSGSINSHCASFSNSNRFLLMQEVHQNTSPRRSHHLEAESIYETRSKNYSGEWVPASHQKPAVYRPRKSYGEKR